MKKLFVNLMLVAVAAMAFVSCQNEGVEEVVRPQEVAMTIIADVDDTRTVIDEANNRVNWSEGDALKVIENSATYRTTTAINIDSNGKAQFTVSFPANTEATSFTYNAIYPASAVVEEDEANKINAERVKVIVKNTQNPTTTSFDPTADILVSKHIETEAQPTELNMQFKRLVALGKMTLKGLPASSAISNATFTVDSENVKALAGRNYVNTVTGEVVEYGYYGDTKSITMNYDEPLTTNNIYFVCNPFEMETGDKFTVKVVCDNVSYSREVTIPEGRSLVFSEGELNTFSVDMTDAKVEEISGNSLPWIESFDSEDLSMYEIVNGESDTKVYPDDNLANGTTKGEILIGKSGGSMTANIASDGKAKTLNLWFKSNKDFIEVSSPTEGVTVTKITNIGYTINLAIGVNTFKVKFTNNNDSNARVDDIVVTEDAPFIESIVAEGMNVLFSTGDEFAFDGTVKAIYTNGITEDVTNDVTVDSSAVKMSVAGTYPVTVTYNDLSTVYEITVQAADVQTTTVELGTGTFADNTITWTEGGVTVVQAKGSASASVSSSYTAANKMRLYQGQTLTFSCNTNITKIELVTSGKYYGNTATVDVGTLTNPKQNDCTITWTGSANKIVLTNGTGSGGEQIRTLSIKITYEVTGESGGETTEPATQTLSFPNATYTATVGESFTAPTLSGAQTTVTYSSSNTAVATVDEITGAVTLVTAGTTTITASAAATDAYKAAEASYTLTVNAAAQGGGETGGETTKTYTFSEYAAGAQYAKNEEHVLDDALTITTTECHFTSELRIYASSTYDGYAIGKLTKGKKIKSLGFNAGNKVDTLNVYGSTDGSTWTLVEGVKITSTSYKDYSVDFGGTNYTYFKLDVAGLNQVRLKSLTLTYQN